MVSTGNALLKSSYMRLTEFHLSLSKTGVILPCQPGELFEF